MPLTMQSLSRPGQAHTGACGRTLMRRVSEGLMVDASNSFSTTTSATNGGGSPLAPVPNNLVRTNVGNHDDAMMRTDSDDSTTTPSTHDQQSDESSDYSMSSLVHDFKALSIHESQRKITHYFYCSSKRKSKVDAKLKSKESGSVLKTAFAKGRAPVMNRSNHTGTDSCKSNETQSNEAARSQ